MFGAVRRLLGGNGNTPTIINDFIAERDIRAVFNEMIEHASHYNTVMIITRNQEDTIIVGLLGDYDESICRGMLDRATELVKSGKVN